MKVKHKVNCVICQIYQFLVIFLYDILSYFYHFISNSSNIACLCELLFCTLIFMKMGYKGKYVGNRNAILLYYSLSNKLCT